MGELSGVRNVFAVTQLAVALCHSVILQAFWKLWGMLDHRQRHQTNSIFALFLSYKAFCSFCI